MKGWEMNDGHASLCLLTLQLLFLASPDQMEMISQYKGERHVLTIKLDTGDAHRRFYFATDTETELRKLHTALSEIQTWGNLFCLRY